MSESTHIALELHQRRQIRTLEQERDALKTQLAKLEALLAAADASLELAEARAQYPPCACMADRKDGICLVHSPAVAKVAADRDRAVELLLALWGEGIARPDGTLAKREAEAFLRAAGRI